MNFLFLNTNFALRVQGKCRKDDVVTAHLSINIKHSTRYKQKVLVGGQENALNHGGQYKSYYFIENLKCHKISLKSVSSQILGARQFLALARFQLNV